MYTNWMGATVNKSCLSAIAEQVVQENGASALAKVGIVKYGYTCRAVIHDFFSSTQYGCLMQIS